MDFELMRNRLIEARERIGYNRKQFAEELNIPYRTITNYENGSREPGSDYITKVADFCGCTTDWILGLSDNPGGSSSNELPVLSPKMKTLVQICDPLSDEAMDRLLAYASDLAWNPANQKDQTTSIRSAEAAYEKSLGFAPSMDSSPLNITSDMDALQKSVVND